MHSSFATAAMLLGLLAAPTLLPAQQAMPVIREEKAGLKAQATLPADSAVAIATRNAPKGATITSAELEEEHGRLIYSFDFKSPGHTAVHEVAIDAKTGAMIASAPESEADEQAEQADDDAGEDDPPR